MIKNSSYKLYFPFPKIRPQQVEALDFIVSNIKNKRFFIAEMPTGSGKSGVAIALSKWIQNNFPDIGCEKGSYIITTQKLLQQQYVDSFQNNVSSVWAKSNYRCVHRKTVSCEEGQLLRKLNPEQKQSEECRFNCVYTIAKNKFYSSPISVTNIAYILNQIEHQKQESDPKKRQLLVIDECHNLEQSIVDFVSCKITKEHIENELKNKKNKIKYPSNIKNIDQAKKWIKDNYVILLEDKIEELSNSIINSKSKADSRHMLRQHSNFNRKISQINRFLNSYNSEDWVLTYDSESFEIKPIYSSKFTEDKIFKLGEKVLLMSGTILDYETFCKNNGIPLEEACFISLSSPFKKENRQVIVYPVCSMSYKYINHNLPVMSEAVQFILEQNKGKKGIVHTHNYKIAKYLEENDKSKRLLLHNSKNRIDILEDHINSKKDSVLVSPSFTEGVDLIHDSSRFQIVCKMPYPFLQDNYIKTKIKKCKNWYEWQTAKTIIQCLGRSVRSEEDYAISYILDSDWEIFYKYNEFLFPEWFKCSLKNIV